MNAKCLRLLLLTLALLSGGLVATAAGDADGRPLGEQMLTLWRARDFAGVVALGEAHRESLLNAARPEYLPLACVARSLPRLGRDEESLAWYERALLASLRPHVLTEYLQAAARVEKLGRARRFLDSLDSKSRALADARIELQIIELMVGGDQASQVAKNEKARKKYARALELHDGHAWQESRARELNEGERRIAEAYTYRQLYASVSGQRRQRLLVRTGLPLKLASTEVPTSATAPPVVVRVAALVVPRTDLTWKEGSELRHEALELSDHELGLMQDTWSVATAATSSFAGHRVRFETEWIRLDGVTLRGLTDRLWNGLVRQRHLDPAKLDPPQEVLFADLVDRFDVIVFAWPRGRSAAAYGGGRIVLPGPKGPLPERGGIRSITDEPHVCLHELLHVVERRVEVPRVHGPTADPLATFARLGVRDELDWYAHVARSVEDWSAVPHRQGHE